MKFEKALARGIVLCDGAMGTQLMDVGLPSNIPAACWNIERPDTILAIHKKYIRAGARAILTNTFTANRRKLEKYKGYDAQKLNCIGVEIARRASAVTDTLIIGDMGPTGVEVELFHALDRGGPSANRTKQDFYGAFREQAVVLAEVGVDAILIETMLYLQEAIIAVKAAKEAVKTTGKNSGIPVICTMAFGTPRDPQRDDFKTLAWGNTLSDVVNGLIEAGAEGIGANCGNVVEAMPQLAQKMRNMTDLPLVFQVNAGSAELDVKTNETVHPLGPVEFAQLISEVAAKGANVLGGCCGTTPDHIAEVCKRLNPSR